MRYDVLQVRLRKINKTLDILKEKEKRKNLVEYLLKWSKIDNCHDCLWDELAP